MNMQKLWKRYLTTPTLNPATIQIFGNIQLVKGPT
uniref:Uncharacterized protein n=1 Tax=Anguilla anguilla TaxID=7936 RepID=A0A0E9TJY4_ANGAN